MTGPSEPSVPLFQSLEGGTVEHEVCPRNREGNTAGTCSLKALAIKVLERNEKWNNCGTTTSKSVPLGSQNFCVCGTEIDANGATEADDRLYEFNERAAILEYDGGFTREEAERLARSHIEENQKTMHRRTK